MSQTIAIEDEHILSEDVFRQMYKYQQPAEPSILKKTAKQCKCSSTTITDTFPIIKWLPKYKFKSDILPDIIAGLTVAVMHIPHGLAYGPLAGQTPVVGLYMAVFPTLIYLFFGTSRHVSLGTFAVMMMMVGKTVTDVTEAQTVLFGNETLNETLRYSNLEVGIAVCFTVGLVEFVLGLLRLGFLWILLSDGLISGFTAAAATHVCILQLKTIFGVPVARFSGPLKLIYFVIDLVKNVPKTNFVTLGISLCGIVILYTFNEFGKPLIKKKYPKMKVPIPMELIIVIFGIIASYFLDLNKNHDVDIVGFVPSGLPAPVIPPFQLIPEILVDCIIMAIVGFSVSLSLANIFAKKSGYEVRTNQELVAFGSANMFASFFQCMPACASLSRTLVCHVIGGQTLICSVVTMTTVILILLILGPVFEPVPFGVLSAIVIVSLKGVVWQAKDLPKIWRQSKLDGIVWLVTFVSVVVIDLDYGLLIGIIMSVLTLVLRNQSVSVLRLARVPDSNLFIDLDSYKGLYVDPDVLILKIIGSLHFANFSNVQNKILKEYKDFMRVGSEPWKRSLVLDLSCVPAVDPTACGGLVNLFNDLKTEHCNFYLAECSDNVYNYLERCKVLNTVPKNNVFFTVLDAVEFLSETKNK